ncbi:MAG: ammonium transporter [Candidatus Sumerlaeaceae bacterium]|nr:ammonium transporter [Candidatus Sumerlaeaceae bacterium]
MKRLSNALRGRAGLVWTLGVAAIVLSGCSGVPSGHKTPEDINFGDTAFLMVSAALVMLMTPALALFYGGLVHARNVLSVVMHSFIALGIITVLWVTVGYSLAFSPSVLKIGGAGLLGGLDWFGVRAVGMTPSETYATTVPHRLFMIYQCMFAIITPALISGAFAERMKFKTYVVFIAIWSLLVYCPVAHWVWSSEGWLLKLGALDFAGGAVVHITSGFTALVCALLIKPRRGFPHQPFIPHNLVLTVLGAGLLWFGWFGFNAGSALGSGQIAIVAFVSTHCAAAAGAVAWMLVDWTFKDKPTLLGAASGAVAGLVAVTPAAGFVGPLSGIAIGLVAGVVCSYACTWRARRGIDDALDAFGVHGVGGTIGALLTGVFASPFLNSAVTNPGLLHGGVKLIVLQVVAVVATVIYTVIVSFVILKVLDLTMGLRVTTEEEQMGLDLTQHGESAYTS